MTAKQASILYALDRFDHSHDLRQDMQNYDFIISNRYVSASMIHQTGKIRSSQERAEFIAWLEDLEYEIFAIPRPDKTIFLNVSPEMSQKLILQKEERAYLKEGKKMDIHEADTTHLIHAHSAAMEIVESHQDWERIDCERGGEMKSIEEIHVEILAKVL